MTKEYKEELLNSRDLISCRINQYGVMLRNVHTNEGLLFAIGSKELNKQYWNIEIIVEKPILLLLLSDDKIQREMGIEYAIAQIKLKNLDHYFQFTNPLAKSKIKHE